MTELSVKDWKVIARDAFKEAGCDNLGLAAAGVAFYAFLAIVPALLAAVLTYGIAVDPATVERHVAAMAEMMPSSATAVVQEQLHSLVQGSSGKKGLGLLTALALALFAARNGAASIITGLNIAYNREESRSFVRRNLLAMLITLGAILGMALIAGAVFVLTSITSLVPGIGGSAIVYKIATYVVLLCSGMAAAGLLYRYGPNRAEPRWQWVTAGSAFAGLGWLLLTLGFGFYVENFGNYDATYGSLSAVIVLLTWLSLSAYVLLLGAELNSAARKHVAAKSAAEG